MRRAMAWAVLAICWTVRALGEEPATTIRIDGKSIVLQVVILSANPIASQIRIDGFAPSKAAAAVEELAGALAARNTAAQPTRIAPRQVEWKHGTKDGAATYTFPAHSFTVIRLE
jgi:hypothetical protein